MKRFRRYFILVVSTLFFFGCGNTQSEKVGLDEAPGSESLAESGKVADVSKINHDEYMQGPHKDFTCSDCHDKKKDKDSAKDRDDDDDHGDYDDDHGDYDGDGIRDGRKRDEDRDKNEKKHAGHKDKKDGKEQNDDDGDAGTADTDGSSSDDTEEFVHVEDFEICANCHTDFSQMHEDNSFGTRCNECHKSGDDNWLFDLRFSYDHTGITNCVNCHSHKGNENVNDHNGNDCESCHTYGDWENILEDASGVSHDYSGNCTSCHSDDRPDTHPVSDSSDRCETCHSYNQWQTGKHEATTGCVNCHEEKSGDMGTQCETCHEYDDWTKITEGSHDSTDNCESCHADTAPNTHPSGTGMCETCHSYEGQWSEGAHDASTGCLDCHDRPNVNGHNNGTQCESCHKYSDWSNVSVSHSDSLVCEECHTDGTNHYGTVVNCKKCHNTNSLPFQHVSTPFPLNHQNTNPNNCKSCHVANDFASSGGCIYCHESRNQKVHKTSSNAQCLSCHYEE